MSNLRVSTLESLGTGGVFELDKLGYTFEYAAGVTVSSNSQIIKDGDLLYQASGSTPLPYTTTGLGMPENGAFVAVGDASDVELRQDLADPDKGAAMVARGVVAIDSIADLLALPEGQRKAGLGYLVQGCRAGSDVGGGEFYWDAGRDKNDHDGIRVYDPSKLWPNFESALEVEAWLEPGQGGSGCFVREQKTELNANDIGLPVVDEGSAYALISKIESIMFIEKVDSYFPAGIYNIGARNFPFRNNNIIDPVLKSYGGATLRGDRSRTVFMTTSTGGADVLQLNAVEGFTVRDIKVTAVLNGSLGAGSNGVSITNGGKDLFVDVEAEDLPYVDKGDYMDGGKAFTIQPANTTNPIENIKANIVCRRVGYGFGMDIVSDNLIENPMKGIDVNIFCDTAYHGVVLSGAANTETVPTNGLDWGVTFKATTINCQVHYISDRAWGANGSIHVHNTTNDLAGYMSGDTETLVASILGSKNERVNITGTVQSVDTLYRFGATPNSGGVKSSTSSSRFVFNVNFQSATTEFDLSNSGGNSAEDCEVSMSHVASFPFADFIKGGNTLVSKGVSHMPDPVIYNTLTLLNPSGVRQFGVRLDGNIESPLTTSSAIGAYVGKKAEYDEKGILLGYRPIYA